MAFVSRHLIAGYFVTQPKLTNTLSIPFHLSLSEFYRDHSFLEGFLQSFPLLIHPGKSSLLLCSCEGHPHLNTCCSAPPTFLLTIALAAYYFTYVYSESVFSYIDRGTCQEHHHCTLGFLLGAGSYRTSDMPWRTMISWERWSWYME